ncbi:efflux RND transporter periplasmic adaptor subunit [bacterium]|nr:efflux RND transporter periplasmic adaptor subunit [bacterium]
MKSFVLVIIGFSIGLMLLNGCTGKSDNAVHEHADEKAIYYCPMHPQITSDKPGVCPICHMDLVKKTDDAGVDAMAMSDELKLSDRKQVLANVATTKVVLSELSKKITAYSYLDFAEQNRRVITARFNGRIEKLYVNKTGDYIGKGQPLFDIYSPDLLQAQNEYLIALNSKAGFDGSLIKSARKKLELYGVTDDQIQSLEKTKEPLYVLTFLSPFSGTVIEKSIQEGIYVNEGTKLYDVADLSVLWNLAEVYENDLPYIKAGRSVELKTQSYPNETFRGTVTFIYPVVNAQTRTVKIRSEFVNTGNKLKPQMYGESSFAVDLGKGIAIPSDAVLFTGKRNVVWIKTGHNTFEAKDVTVGMKIDGQYQILSGLKEGDEIAVTGGFLIDSESQLRTGLATDDHQHD